MNDSANYESHRLYIVNESYRGLAWYMMIGYVCYISTWDTYVYSVIGPFSLSFRHQQCQLDLGQRGLLQGASSSSYPMHHTDVYPKRFMGKLQFAFVSLIHFAFIIAISHLYYTDGVFHRLHLDLFCALDLFNCQHHIYSLYKFVLVCFTVNNLSVIHQ